MNARQQKQNLVPTTEEEMENHQQGDDISKFKEKTESAYQQVTQIEINKKTKTAETTNYVQNKRNSEKC